MKKINWNFKLFDFREFFKHFKQKKIVGWNVDIRYISSGFFSLKSGLCQNIRLKNLLNLNSFLNLRITTKKIFFFVGLPYFLKCVKLKIENYSLPYKYVKCSNFSIKRLMKK